MVDPTKWDWADAISGAVMGVLTAIVGLFGWFGRKIGTVHDRIDRLQERMGTQQSSIAVLEAHHDAKMERLASIEDHLAAIDEKQNRQIEILLALKGPP